MSLFGAPKPSGGGLFGNTGAGSGQSSTPSLFGNTANNQQQQPAKPLFGASTSSTTPASSGSSVFGSFGNTGQQQGTGTSTGTPSLFGGAQQSSGTGGSSLFGGGANTQQSSGTPSLFGNTQNNAQQQPTSGGSLFGSTANQQQQQNSTPSLFGNTANNQTQTGGSGLFGNTQNQQQKPSFFGGFGNTQSQPQQTGGSSLFGGGALGSTAQPQQQQQQQQQDQQQQPQLGATLGASQLGQTQGLGSTLWTPGQGMTGVHRTVPMQIMIVNDKWNPYSRTSPFRTYLYNNVGEDQAPFYQPGPNDDEAKWEEALRKRPGPSYVPVLVQGFMELGKRAQRQRDYLTMMQMRLHEINNALTELLQKHNLHISIKIASCRRRHLVLSQRVLALAAKTEVLRNRGYAMDESEVELQKKLQELERSVFDPLITGRVEEVWARMMAIRERSKRLQQELEQLGEDKSAEGDVLDEATIRTAKRVLEDYAKQIQHLDKELASVQEHYESISKAS